MKNKTECTTQGQDQSLKNILYVWNGFNQKNANSKMGESRNEQVMPMNQTQGKAPPGYSGGSDPGRSHPPENRGDPPAIKNKLFTKEFKHINKLQNQIFTNF